MLRSTPEAFVLPSAPRSAVGIDILVISRPPWLSEFIRFGSIGVIPIELRSKPPRLPKEPRLFKLIPERRSF